MKKIMLHIALCAATLLSMGAVYAGQYGGPYFGAKLGKNNSSAVDATGVEIAPKQGTVAYFAQGGHLQGGYNLDLNFLVIGVGAYGDWNGYAKYASGLAYATRSYGFDAKLGVPVGNWLPYAKLGRGRNTATEDLRDTYQSGPNTAFGFEYKLASHWSTVAEYKSNKFSNQNGTVTINNKTITLGLNYHFNEPPLPVLPPEIEPEPEPEQVFEPALEFESEPEVDEIWKTFMEEKPVRIEDANFVAGSAKLNLEADQMILGGVLEFVSEHPDANLEVIGYADNTGSDKLNKDLSLARANAVKQFLIDSGIAADRITTKGEGSANPVGDNSTVEGRAQNRRVEIRSVVNQEIKVRVTP